MDHTRVLFVKNKRIHIFSKKGCARAACDRKVHAQLYLQVFVAIISPQYFPFCAKEAL